MPKVKKGAGWISLARDLTGDPGKVARVRDYYNSKGIYRLHGGMTLPPLPDYIAKGGASGGRAAQKILGGGIEAQEGRPGPTATAPPTATPTTTTAEPSSGKAARDARTGRGGQLSPAIGPTTPEGLGEVDPGAAPLPPEDRNVFENIAGAIGGGIRDIFGTGGEPAQPSTAPSFFETMGAGAVVGSDPISFASQQAAGTIPAGPGGGSFFAEPPPVTADEAYAAAWQSFVDTPSNQFTYNATKTRGKISLYEQSGNRGHLPQTISSSIAASIMNQFPLSEGLPAQSVQEFMDILDYTEAEPGIWVKDNPITSTAGYSTGFAGLSGPRYSYSRGSVSRRNGSTSNYGAFSSAFLYGWNIGWA